MMRIKVVSGDRLLYRGDKDCRFHGRRGEYTDWYCEITKELFSFSDEELREETQSRGASSKLIQGGDAAPRPHGAPLGAPLAAEDQAAAERRLAYVLALHEAGIRPGVRVSNAELTIIMKSVSCLRGEKTPSARTARRLLKLAGHRPNLAALAPNTFAKGNRRPPLHPEVREIIERRIDERYMIRAKPSVKTIKDEIEGLIQIENLRRSDPLLPPSEKAVKAAIDRRDQYLVARARKGELSARIRYLPKVRQKRPEAPLDVIENDHTIADMFVVDGERWLPLGRPTISFSIDRATAMPHGYHVSFEPESVYTVGECLRNGMYPKTYVKKKIESGQWNIRNDWPVWGLPKKIVLDRAMHNIGKDFAMITGGLGIHQDFAPSRCAWYKGMIERMLRTVNQNLLHEHPGTSFSNVIDRGDYDPRRNAVITLDQLIEVLHKWMLDIYSCGAHKGIRDVPRRLWDELTERYPIDPLPVAHGEIDPLLGRTEFRTLTNLGIAFENIQYISDELVFCLRETSFREAAPGNRVTIKYCAGDLGHLWVYLPHIRQFLKVPAGPAFDYAEGMSLWQLKLINKYVAERMKSRSDRVSICQAKLEIADTFRAKMDKSVRGASVAARYFGIGRRGIAADDDGGMPVLSAPRTRKKSSRLKNHRVNKYSGRSEEDHVDVYED